jgi:FKBP-type peptidyl-prolyl cis-trans isomerase
MSIPAPDNIKKAPADATVTSSGLAYITLQAGDGDEKPTASAKVEVHYTGWMTNGKMFDSSVARGTPITFGLNQVIKGWTEGVQTMVVGEKKRFWIPGDLAYGNEPSRPGFPYGMLVFDVELLSFKAPPPPPKVPKNIKAAPDHATVTQSGLAYVILQAGEGSICPKASSQVKVHYTGWMTDGKMFDSSVVRGEPITFGLNQVIKGWTEGVQTMVVGEKKRFWIPGALAYGEKQTRPGFPFGTLVFDVELLSFE